MRGPHLHLHDCLPSRAHKFVATQAMFLLNGKDRNGQMELQSSTDTDLFRCWMKKLVIQVCFKFLSREEATLSFVDPLGSASSFYSLFSVSYHSMHDVPFIYLFSFGWISHMQIYILALEKEGLRLTYFSLNSNQAISMM